MNLGLDTAQGKNMPADLRAAVSWFRLAKEHNDAAVRKDAEHNIAYFATLQPSTPGMPVTVFGLTGSPHFNGRVGIVQASVPKPGRLAVLLDGDKNPTSIRETNLRKADGF